MIGVQSILLFPSNNHDSDYPHPYFFFSKSYHSVQKKSQIPQNSYPHFKNIFATFFAGNILERVCIVFFYPQKYYGSRNCNFIRKSCMNNSEFCTKYPSFFATFFVGNIFERRIVFFYLWKYFGTRNGEFCTKCLIFQILPTKLLQIFLSVQNFCRLLDLQNYCTFYQHNFCRFFCRLDFLNFLQILPTEFLQIFPVQNFCRLDLQNFCRFYPKNFCRFFASQIFRIFADFTNKIFAEFPHETNPTCTLTSYCTM